MSLSLKGLQRVALHLLCLVPVLWLFSLAATDGLGANPAEALLRDLGLWALRFVCLALAVTPLRVWLGWTRLAAYRRMLGLYAFFYGSLHWLCYLLLDMGLDWAAVLEDLAKRPFILVGTLAWGILLVLAVTSIPRLIRRLGASAGRPCTARSMRRRRWPCCTSGGCVPARTTWPRWVSTWPSWPRCCWRACCTATPRGGASVPPGSRRADAWTGPVGRPGAPAQAWIRTSPRRV